MSNGGLTKEEQLMQLKAMTVRLGVIHEAQALQLKMWPLLIPNIGEAESKVDVETKTVIMVCKTAKGKKFRNTSKVKMLCENIDKWVKLILWNETALSIVVDGKTIYGMNYASEE